MQAPPLSLNLTPHGKLHHKAKAYEVTENFETFVTFQHPHLPGRATEGPPETSLQRYIAVVGTSLWSVHPLAMPNAQPPPPPKRGRPLLGGLFSGTSDFWMSCRRLSAQLLNIRAHLVQSVESAKPYHRYVPSPLRNASERPAPRYSHERIGRRAGLVWWACLSKP